MQNLNLALPALMAYWADHNSYAGATPTKLRNAYDPSIPEISISGTSKKAVCIEAVYGSAHVFVSIPSSEIMLGSCADQDAGRPYDQPAAEEPSRSDESPSSLRASIPAIEAYWQDHSSYSGMTLPKLRAIDAGLPALKIVSAKKESYCVEITVDGASSFAKSPPLGNIKQGHCPA